MWSIVDYISAKPIMLRGVCTGSAELLNAACCVLEPLRPHLEATSPRALMKHGCVNSMVFVILAKAAR